MGLSGSHSAAATTYDWPFDGGLVGADFSWHPDIQTAVIHGEDANYPSTASLPDVWVRTDEWYNFGADPMRSSVRWPRVDRRCGSWRASRVPPASP